MWYWGQVQPCCHKILYYVFIPLNLFDVCCPILMLTLLVWRIIVLYKMWEADCCNVPLIFTLRGLSNAFGPQAHSCPRATIFSHAKSCLTIWDIVDPNSSISSRCDWFVFLENSSISLGSKWRGRPNAAVCRLKASREGKILCCFGQKQPSRQRKWDLIPYNRKRRRRQQEYTPPPVTSWQYWHGMWCDLQQTRMN